MTMTVTPIAVEGSSYKYFVVDVGTRRETFRAITSDGSLAKQVDWLCINGWIHIFHLVTHRETEDVVRDAFRLLNAQPHD